MKKAVFILFISLFCLNAFADDIGFKRLFKNDPLNRGSDTAGTKIMGSFLKLGITKTMDFNEWKSLFWEFFYWEKSSEQKLDKKQLGFSLLQAVMKEGNLIEVKILVTKGAPLNAKDEFGNTPLILSSSGKILGQDKIVYYLVRQGADLEQKNLNGETAIFHTIRFRNHEILEYLIDHGAKISIFDKYGKSPVFRAAMEKNDSMLNYMVSKGADINLRNEEGASPLDLAIREKNENAVDMLLKHNAKVNQYDETGKTPLIQAIKIQSRYIVEQLLEKGADPFKKDRTGMSPMEHAKKLSQNQSIRNILTIYKTVKIKTISIKKRVPRRTKVKQ